MANYVRVAGVHDLSPGERRVFEVDDMFVVVFNVGGQFYAIEDACTHDDGPLAEGELEGHEIVCPRHGARFDIRDGRVLSFPAITPVRSFPVRVEGDDVLIDIG